MPVEDSPVHPITVGSARYDACRTKVAKSGYWARDVRHNMMPPKDVWVWVESRFSTECRYDKSLSDPKCAGCDNAGSGEAYAAGVRKRAEGV